MGNEIIARPLIDPHLDSYKGFFDHGWCGRIFEAVNTTSLNHPVGALMLAWRSANGVHLLPWLMVESLRKFAIGEAEGSLQYRASYADEVIKGVVSKIEMEMHYSLKQEQKKQPQAGRRQDREEAGGAMKTCRSKWRLMWNGTGILSFRCPSSSSVSLTYCTNYGSVFFAYEDFLANVIRTKEPTSEEEADQGSLCPPLRRPAD